MSDNIADLVARLNGKHTQSQCGNFVEVHPDFLREAAQALTRIAGELRQVEAENEAERIANAQLFDRAYAAEVERDRLRPVLRDMVARFELYAGPNDMHAGHHDLELLRRAREALRGETK